VVVAPAEILDSLAQPTAGAVAAVIMVLQDRQQLFLVELAVLA
jgi:hypothetical protein